MKNEFKVGDLVRVRDWDDMLAEFGHTQYSTNTINCKYRFTPEMRKFCGTEFIITLIDSSDLIKGDDERINRYAISSDMLELVADNSEDLEYSEELDNFLCDWM